VQTTRNERAYTRTHHTLQGINGFSGADIHRLLCPEIAGSLAGAVSCVLVYPIDTLRRRMQLNTSKGTVLSMAREIGKAGPGGFYRGLPLALCKAVPSSALQFWMFEQLKHAWSLDDVIKISSPPLHKLP
jgi:hypothetical protein